MKVKYKIKVNLLKLTNQINLKFTNHQNLITHQLFNHLLSVKINCQVLIRII
jgi:hypothetical protein